MFVLLLAMCVRVSVCLCVFCSVLSVRVRVVVGRVCESECVSVFSNELSVCVCVVVGRVCGRECVLVCLCIFLNVCVWCCWACVWE